LILAKKEEHDIDGGFGTNDGAGSFGTPTLVLKPMMLEVYAPNNGAKRYRHQRRSQKTTVPEVQSPMMVARGTSKWRYGDIESPQQHRGAVAVLQLQQPFLKKILTATKISNRK